MKAHIWLPQLLLGALLTGCGGSGSDSATSGDDDNTGKTLTFTSVEALGESLFNDANLSLNRTQSCATCHNPDHAFVDNRLDDSGNVMAVSTGDDGVSLGDRNAPSAAYASLAPEFGYGSRSRFNSQQSDYEGYLGGQFHDGRAATLKDQAAGPPLNSIEMGMPDAASVVARLQENEDYLEAFAAYFGDTIFDDTDGAYAAMTEAIAAFEQTSMFAPFDSKYDRSLLSVTDANRYVYDPLDKATLGKSLFFSQQFTNCATCHQLNAQGSKTEPFTGYEYHNIGVPANSSVRLANGSADGYVDTGLQTNNAVVTAATEQGKFKVPTLRNVAVTGPYMHNGVFADLATVIKFYDHYLPSSGYSINPETGVAWAAPEVSDTISLTELQDGNALSEEEVEALVCFLRTLTDARYESLLPDDGLCD